MKRLLALLPALLLFYTASADTFTVISNADSGPGTLREAVTLANANGIAVPDIINFNIAGTTEAERTITLQSELPVLSSGITIDGSTQNGAVLGISTAKITLYLDHFTPVPFRFFYIEDASAISIFGICFKFFEDPNIGGADNYAVYLRRSHHITVGAPGKGNLFTSVRYGVTNTFWNYYYDTARYVTIQANVFGLNSNNLPISGGGLIAFINAENIQVGGPSSSEGNVIIGTGINISQAPGNTSPFFVKVQNNKLCVNWDGSRYYNNEGFIFIHGFVPDDPTVTKTFILDNVICGGSTTAIGLDGLNHKAIVQGNKVGTGITGTTCERFNYNYVGFSQCKNVIVGGYTAAEENSIATDILTQPHGVHIIKNKLGWIQMYNSTPGPDPFATIVTYDNGLITGKSNPNSKIQLYTNTCYVNCISREYLTTIYADASGNWSFPYTAAMPNIVATATMADSSTSAFTQPIVNHLGVVLQHPTCGKSNGSIKGIIVTEGTHIRWLDGYTGQVISTDTNLVNVPAGSYGLQVSNGANGCSWGVNFALYDNSLPASVSCVITNASCGQNNGIISNPGYISATYKWLNANYDSVGTGYFANKLAPGLYYLKAWIPYDTSCNKLYGPFEVKNLTGPTVSTNNMLITDASCSKNNGSITGLTAVNTTGIPFIQWVDSLNKPAGNGYDLVNAPPGKYRFKFKDDGSCDSIITSFYTIRDNGKIIIDTVNKLVTASKCAGISGRIEQVNVTGGETYQWINIDAGNLAGNSADLLNVAPGNYQLQVSNHYGCSKTSPVIIVPQAAFSDIGITGVTVRDALCAAPNGTIKINSFNKDSALYSFRWADSTTAQLIGMGTAINNLPTGTYQLYARDGNACEKIIFTAHIISLPVPSFDYTALLQSNDNCNLQQGSITALKVNGLVGPTTYTWYNQLNTVAGSAINLQNAAAGTYSLLVTDAGVCNIKSKPFIISNTDNALLLPAYDNIIIPRYSDATLIIKNKATGIYTLSKLADGTDVVQQNNNGNFVVPKIATDTSFYIKRTMGNCISPVVQVNIKVVDKSYFAIPTAFTPNHDGKNDRLSVKVVGYIELNYFRIFNRFGTLIFETQKINDGWDGYLKGMLQDTGGYVWIAQGKDINGKTITEKGSFILLR